MEINQKGRYLTRIQVKEDGELKVKAFVIEANLQRDVYTKLQMDYGITKEVDFDSKEEGIRGVRLINGETV